MFPPVPARERVHAYVKDGILRGVLPGGTFLEEERISAAVGVSRTPVREAFQQLHGERLIDLLPRRGAMVRVVTVQELLEIYETRLMIEVHAVRKLCRLGGLVPMSMLEAHAAMCAEPIPGDLAHVRLNSAFHQALVAAAGNGVVSGLYASLNARQELVAMVSVSLEPARLRLILDEHAALVGALKVHDAERAAAILNEHLSPARELVARLPRGQAAVA